MPQEKVEVPITGTRISVNVSVGDQVSEGDVLCVLESMKMENPIIATTSGKVTAINVKQGQVAKSGDVVAVIEY